MDALIGAAGAIAAAALTPGPNNFVVMRTAARGGLAAALPAIAGVVLGSLALLALIVAGAGAAFDAVPHLREALAIAGCLYLVYLGARLMRGGSGKGTGPATAAVPAAQDAQMAQDTQAAQYGKPRENLRAARETPRAADSQERLPAGVAGLFGFQFLNPKSWVLVFTATAATPAGWGGLARFGRLAALFAIIPTLSLLLWAALGKATAAAGTWLDRILGALLIASALLLLAEV
jgi:threonine/homoserine/homoserine lactone efflux protein